MERKVWEFTNNQYVITKDDGTIELYVGKKSVILEPDFAVNLALAILQAASYSAKNIIKPLLDAPKVLQELQDTAKEVQEVVGRFEQVLKETK